MARKKTQTKIESVEVTPVPTKTVLEQILDLLNASEEDIKKAQEINNKLHK